MFLVIILVIPFLNSCSDDDTADLVGNWIELSDFEGLPRSDAVGFSIGLKGYVGTGYDGTDRLSDFWEFDPARNSWTQKADFPGKARNGAVGFGTDTKGYIGTGYDGLNKLNDFYEFNPVTNSWTKKADFEGSPRYSAVGMALNNKGYVGTGYSGYYMKDFWQYDPDTDTWTQKTSVGGSKRKDATCFTIDGKGYIMTGIDNGVYEDDMWEYDPNTDLWTEKRSISDATDLTFDDDYTSLTGVYKVGFSIKGLGYIATGGQTAGVIVWEYDPSTDLWTEKTNFEGTLRAEGVGFAVGDYGYITTGKNGTYYLDDMWGFDPNAEYNEYD
jgi:N-acetylneuraminic acid mutarotase